MALIKITWQERAKDTAKFHADQLRGNNLHRIQDTADMLHRSKGSIAEDILLANWCKTHPKVAECRTAAEALEFIRSRKFEMRIR